MDERPSQLQLSTSSDSMQRALNTLLLAARSEASIMFCAEIGSEVTALARLAHDNSRHRDRPFLPLSCPWMTELPSGELAAASGGTLFLDEVGNLDGGLQTKLVHLIDRLAAQTETTRVISATKCDLTEDAGERHFRKELLFRLNVVEIRIPPLRERPEDILPLARSLIASLSADLGRPAPALSEEAAAALLQYSWPANLREVKNVIERALLIWPGDTIQAEALADIMKVDDRRHPRVGADVTLRDLEREHISRIMTRVQSLKRTAAILGIDKTTLWRRLKQDKRNFGGELHPGKAH